MITFIAGQIESKAEISIEQGQAKYRAYFVKTKLYSRYKAEVDAILYADNFGAVIVNE